MANLPSSSPPAPTPPVPGIHWDHSAPPGETWRATGSTPAPAGLSDPRARPEPGVYFSSSQREAAAEALQRHWTGDPAILARALGESGLQRQEPGAPDTRSLGERAYDDTLAGADPASYNLNGVFVGRRFTPQDGAGSATEQAAALQGMLQDAFAAIELPVEMASGLANTILDAANKLHSLPTEAERTAHMIRQRSTAARVTGEPDFAKMMQTVKIAVDKMPRETAQLLSDRGIFEDGAVLAHLFRQGQRLQSRGNR